MKTTTVQNPIWAGIEDLAPGYFAMVMATGIISIAVNLLQMKWIAFTLFYINIVAYGVLWVLTLVRLIFFPKRMLSDLMAHATGPGYFTLVAGTCVLGSNFVNLFHNFTVAIALWLLGGVLWMFIMYAFFTAVVTRSEKPTIEQGINGAWLIAAVATQSISVLGTLIAPQIPGYQQIILFIALIFYLLGCMLYLNIIALIFYRFTFFVLKPETLTPPYWINMGAVAIATLAGSTLMLNANQWDLLTDLTPYLKGFTLFFWATGSWWIPLLIILGIWRHIHKQFPLEYNPLYWGMVFPLGMYTASTFQLAKAMKLDFLMVIPHYFIYLALLAWLLTAYGLVHRLITTFRAVLAVNRPDPAETEGEI